MYDLIQAFPRAVGTVLDCKKAHFIRGQCSRGSSIVRTTSHRPSSPSSATGCRHMSVNQSAGGGHRQSAARPVDCAILYRYMPSLAFPSHRQYTPFVSHRPSAGSHCVLATAHTSLILGVAVLVLQAVAVLALSISSVLPPWTLP